MSLMSKLLMSTLIAGTTLSSAATDTTIPNEKELIKYIKKNIIRNPQVTVNGVKIIEQQTNDALVGWKILLLNIDVNVTFQNKVLKVPEMVFVKDGLIAPELVDIKNGNSFRNDIKPSIPAEMYDDAHLILGNKDAKHKIMIFSDPQCPFCQESVPPVLEVAKENPEKIALYYYHLPLLNIHPVSGILTRIMHLAQKEGKGELYTKFYAMKLDARETNETKIIDAVEKETGFKVTKKQLHTKELEDAMKVDEDAASRMMVTGTPTIYIDGRWDKMRDGYKKLID